MRLFFRGDYFHCPLCLFETWMFLIVITLSFISMLSYAEEPSEILARVNGVPITLNEVEGEISRIIPQTLFHRSISPEKREGFKKDALERLIEKELQYQEARKQGIKAEKSEVREKVEEVKKRFPSKKAFEEAMKKNKRSMKDYEAMIEKELIVNKIFTKEVEERAKIGDIELKDYYDKNKEKFKEPEKIKLRHIVIMFDPSKGIEDKDRAQAKTEEILKRANSGEDFAALASEHSEDVYKVKGGDFGYIHRGRMEPEIEKKAFNLKIGEVMGPVETEYGFYIFKLEDRIPEKQFSFDEIKDKIKRELEKKSMEERKTDWNRSLREKAKIEYQ